MDKTKQRKRDEIISSIKNIAYDAHTALIADDASMTLNFLTLIKNRAEDLIQEIQKDPHSQT